jgi:site-specific recombinase XerD
LWCAGISWRLPPFSKHVVKRGKTPVLTADQARRLIESIDVSTFVGLRDRALIGVMTYAFARIGAVVAALGTTRRPGT